MIPQVIEAICHQTFLVRFRTSRRTVNSQRGHTAPGMAQEIRSVIMLAWTIFEKAARFISRVVPGTAVGLSHFGIRCKHRSLG